jgi:LCP family protein required for cell wall assembly
VQTIRSVEPTDTPIPPPDDEAGAPAAQPSDAGPDVDDGATGASGDAAAPAEVPARAEAVEPAEAAESPAQADSAEPEVPARAEAVEPVEAAESPAQAESAEPEVPAQPEVDKPTEAPAFAAAAAGGAKRRMTVHRAEGAPAAGGMGGGDGAVEPPTPPAGGESGSSSSPSGMKVYTTAPAQKRRRWPKVLVGVLGVFAVLAIGVGGFGYWYLQDTVAAITQTADVEQRAAQEALDAPLPNQPITALIIGADARPGERVSRSDTLMLVRVDPRTQSIAMLSFPRDLIVDVPGYGTRPINEAYQLGQEPLVLDTIKQMTGLSINYLVPVDFRAFQRVVGTFGGVYVPVDRRYFNKNDGSAANNYADIDLQPGYQLLRGTDALSFARYRHTDSDIVRMARQQVFVSEFKKRVDAWGAASRVIELISIVRDNLKVLGSNDKEADARTLLDYGRLIAGIPRENMVQVRLERVSPAPSMPTKVVASPEAIQEAVNKFLRPDLKSGEAIADRDVAKDPKKKAEKPSYDPATMPIEVRNGNGTPAAAADASWQLIQNGWKLASSTGDSMQQYLQTTVFYNPETAGTKEASKAIAESFGAGSEVRPLDATVQTELEAGGVPVTQPVVVVVGQTYQGDLAPPKVPVLPEKEEAQIERDPTRDVEMWREAQKKSGLPLMMPTVVYRGARTRDPNYSSQPPYRVYDVQGKKAVYVTYSADTYDTVFGVQAIDWEDPPILDGPTTERTLKNGRKLSLYFNGDKLMRVAWRQDGVTYWLENSLTGRIPNSAMIAMAKSFKPVGR